MAFKKFDGNPRRDFPPRQMFNGNWKCAGCGAEITELPFEPSPDRPIYCRDCWAKKRAERPRRF
jgi:CxxC-x17-CxxC domain-containing protein